MKPLVRAALFILGMAVAVSSAHAQSSAGSAGKPATTSTTSPKPAATTTTTSKPATGSKPVTSAKPPARHKTGSAERLDGIAAVVNDDVILESDVEEQLYLFLLKAQAKPDSAVVDTLRGQILDQLINFKLIVAEAKRTGLTVNANDLKGINREVEGAVADVRGRFQTEEEFQKQLQSENMTEAKLREKYRNDLELQVLFQKLVEKQLPHQTVTASEAESYFKANLSKFPKVPEQIHVQVIQIPPTADSSVDLKGKNRALEIRKRITSGEKFAKVAAEVSDDSNTARSGGDLGFLPHGSLDGPLDDAAFALKLNEVSAPIRSAAGWHIMQVLERDTLKTAAGKDSLEHGGKPALEAHVRHILVRVPVEDADVEHARKLAERIRAEAMKGGDFGALARKYSRYEGTVAEDGDLGFVPITAFQPSIRAGLDAAPIGGITDVLENSAGFNIFKVKERKPERAYQLDEIRDDLPQVVAEMKQREQYDQWVKSLRSKAHIEIRNS